MITDEQAELIIERLLRRVEQANISFLRSIGSSIRRIQKLDPTRAQQLIQILKYGDSYDQIVKQLSKYTDLNVKEVEEILSTYAKKDQMFYEQFYKYRGIPFVEYDQNETLKRQTQSLINIVQNEMYDYTRNNVLGYSIRDLGGNLRHLGLKETYNQLLDVAYLNVNQGKETFDAALYRILKDIGSSGLKTIDYASGRSVRLDSVIRMHMKARLRELHNENQKLFGEEFGSDGVEISVHLNPASDHENAQGRQFSNEQYNELQTNGSAIDYEGKLIDLHGSSEEHFRPISELNCYHYVFAIVLGVSKPLYSKKQLKEIIDKNNEGFELDGKHYTNYEGTQLQRRLETEIRRQKDLQILGRESGNDKIITESQKKITSLTNKYNKLSEASGLPSKMKRMRVSGYHRLPSYDEKVDFNKDNFIDFNPRSNEDLKDIGQKYFDFESNEALDFYITRTSKIKERIQNGDVQLKQQLDRVEPEVDRLAQPSPIPFKLFSAKDITTNYEQNSHLLSGSISRSVANLHVNKRINKEVITIYVEKGSPIISTYNAGSNHFNRQGEIILPTKKNLKRIDKYTYLLKK